METTSSTTCNFCGKTFKNKYNLNVHISTSKACLKIQNKQNENKFSCSNCGKSYTRNFRLKNHKCKGVANTVINNTTNITNNNTTNNITNNNTTINNTTNITIIKPKKIEIVKSMIPLDLSEDAIREIVQREFTLDYLLKNHQGVAQFIIDKILKKDHNTGNYNYISLDGSRYIGVYKDNETGNIIKDHSYMKLAKPVYNQAYKRGFVLANEVLTNEEVKEIDDDKFFKKEVASAIEMIRKYDDPHPRFKKIIANKTAIVLDK